MDNRIKKIADHYGFTSQADMLIEESAEFTQAVSKLRRGHIEAFDNLKEELADVLIVAEQLRYIIGSDEIDDIINRKLTRQLERMQNEDS